MRRTPAVGDFDARTGFGWRFNAPLYVAAVLNPVNTSLIATAIVPIATDVGVSVGSSAILISALYLATSIGQPTAGKLAEVFGARRTLVVGTVLVILGGAAGSAGTNLATLIIARVLIGAGASGSYPAAMLLIRRRATQAGLDAPPGRVLGGLVIAGTVTAAAGLPIGGLLVDTGGWRSTFFINVPVGLMALAMALMWIPADPKTTERRTLWRVLVELDVVGMAGFAGSAAALLIFLLSLPHPAWVGLVLAVVLGTIWIGWELHASRPFIDIRLLKADTALTRTYLRYALTTFCMYSVLYGVTQWLQASRAFSAKTAGLMLLPMTAVGAVLAQPISARNLLRGPLIAAGVSCLLGSIGVLLVDSRTADLWIMLITLIFGITLATTASASQTAVYIQAAEQQIAIASGLLRSFGYIGSIASSAIISVVFHGAVNDQGLHLIAAIMVGVSLIGIIALAADPIIRSGELPRMRKRQKQFR